MGRILGRLFRPGLAGLLAFVLAAGGGTVAVLRAADAARKPAAAPPVFVPPDVDALLHGGGSDPKLLAAPTPTPTPTKPKPTPKPAPRKKAAPPKPAGPDLRMFNGLGAWVDLYDDELDPAATTQTMKEHGVKTLYLQTGRYNVPGPASPLTFPPGWIDPWLHAAHERGIKVVGWYLPAYDDMARDIRRTVAISTYRSSKGQRFDAISIDIEYRRLVKQAEWMEAVATHAAAVRRSVGKGVAVAGIVQPPLLMDTAPHYWAGFPWQRLGAQVDVMMPMAYWTATAKRCAGSPDYCAYGYTKRNVEEIHRRTGMPRLPVHVIGGVGDACDTAEVADYVSATLASASKGGSLYDFGVTKPEWWALLERLNR